MFFSERMAIGSLLTNSHAGTKKEGLCPFGKKNLFPRICTAGNERTFEVRRQSRVGALEGTTFF